MTVFNKIEVHRTDKLTHLYNKDVAESLLAAGHQVSESLNIPVFVHFRDIWIPSNLEWGQLVHIGAVLYKFIGAKNKGVKFVPLPGPQ